jgi:teichuronic acid exporter
MSQAGDTSPPSSTGYADRAFRSVLWSGVNSLAPTLINLGVFVITSRLLKPADFGAVAIAASLGALASALTPAGFGEALVQRKSLKPAHIDSVFWLCVVSGILSYGLLCLLAGTIARLFSLDLLRILLPVMGLRVVFDMISVVPNALIVRKLSFHLVAMRTVMATAVAAAISLALIFAGYGLWALVLSQLANYFVIALVNLGTAGWLPRFSASRHALRELSEYGLFASSTRGLQFFLSQADQSIIGYVLGTTQLGLYNFARQVYSMLNEVFSGALTAVAHPMFAGVQSEQDKVRRGFLLASFLSSVVSFPVFAGLGLVADRAVPLFFGDQWNDALWLIRIFCVHGIISCIGLLQSGLIRSQGHARWWFYYSLLNGVLSIVIVFVFARYGATTMLAINVAKSYLFWPLSVAMTLRLLAIGPRDYGRQFAAPALAAMIMIGAVLLLRSLLPAMSPLAGLVIDIAAGGLSYAVAILLLAPKQVGVMRTLVLGLIDRRTGRREVVAEGA